MKNSRGQRPGIVGMHNYSATPAIDASTSVDDNVLIPEVPCLTYQVDIKYYIRQVLPAGMDVAQASTCSERPRIPCMRCTY